MPAHVGLPPLEDALKALRGEDNRFPLVGSIEKAFDHVGLMKASWTPIARAGVGFALGAGVMHALNGMHMAPFAFDEYGNARPFKLLEPHNDEATYFHWAVPAGFLAFVCGGII